MVTKHTGHPSQGTTNRNFRTGIHPELDESKGAHRMHTRTHALWNFQSNEMEQQSRQVTHNHGQFTNFDRIHTQKMEPIHQFDVTKKEEQVETSKIVIHCRTNSGLQPQQQDSREESHETGGGRRNNSHGIIWEQKETICHKRCLE